MLVDRDMWSHIRRDLDGRERFNKGNTARSTVNVGRVGKCNRSLVIKGSIKSLLGNFFLGRKKRSRLQW